jgi:phosphoserine aminotransferase
VAPEPDDVQLPDSLLPGDGRFGCGPSKVRTDAVAALAEAAPTFLGTSHRREGVKSVVRRVREGVATLFGLPDGYEVLLGLGGTTTFWDAAAFGLIERRSQHLAFGEFSAKFAAVVRAAPHLEDPTVIESSPGTHPRPRPSPTSTRTASRTTRRRPA